MKKMAFVQKIYEDESISDFYRKLGLAKRSDCNNQQVNFKTNHFLQSNFKQATAYKHSKVTSTSSSVHA